MKTSWVIACVFVCAMTAAWVFRWQVIPLSSGGDVAPMAYLLNRWTGEVRILRMWTYRNIPLEQPAPQSP